MCGRATLTREDAEELAAELEAEIAPADARSYRRRFNVAPSDLHWIVEPGADRRVLLPARWGYLASGRPLINVRGEQVASGHGFRDAFAARRCLVVTDGFFEWTKPERAPVWFHRPDGGLVLLAGLYQAAHAGAAHAHAHAGDARPAAPRFTILTTRPNRLVARVHDRMPVIVPPDRLDVWLAGEPTAAARLIAAAPEDALLATPVSKRVSSVKNDDPACLSPPEPDEAGKGPRQGTLF